MRARRFALMVYAILSSVLRFRRKAVTQWYFHRYALNGKAQYFHATVTFPVK